MTPEQLHREAAVSQLNFEHSQKMAALHKEGEAIERRMQTLARDSAIESALAGVEFVSDAAKRDATMLLRNAIHISSDGQAHGPQWQPAEQYVRETMNSEAWAHFRKPTAPAPATQSQPPPAQNPFVKPASTPAPPTPALAPMMTPPPALAAASEPWVRPDENLGQAYLRHWTEQRAAMGMAGNPQTNVRLPFGLRPK
jgi:hypothetical protein